MKKFLLLFLAFALVFGIFPICAKAQDMSNFYKGAYIVFDDGTTNGTRQVRVGEKLKVKAVLILNDGNNTKQVLNDTADFANLTFTAPNNVEFTNDGQNAYVTGLKAGDSTIAFHYGAPDSNVNGSSPMCVYDFSLSPSYNHIYLLKNKTKRITVKANWTNQEATDVTGSCTFESTNPAVAVVNQSPVNPAVDGNPVNQTGRIYPVSTGFTNINITYLGKTVQIPVYVMQLTIGSQSGTLITGTGGTATYAVTGIGMYDGSPLEVQWCDANGNSVSAPAGISVPSTQPTLTNNSATYTITATNTAETGTYYFKLFSNIETAITSDNIATVTVAPNIRSSEKAITGFFIGGNAGTIDETNHKIAVTVPFGTDVSSLPPSITVSDKATVSPAGGIAQNFATPVTYTVTAEDETTQPYTVTVIVAPDTRSSAKAITGFKIGSTEGTINETDHTIAVTLPYATNVTGLTPTITVSDKATVSPAGGVVQDFTSPVIYTVKAENESTQTYTVTVTIAADTRSSAKAITGFKIGSVDGTINETDHTIAVTLPYGTDVKSLTPTITVSDKATVSPASGAVQSFTSAVTYTVKAENESAQTYTVTVTIAADTRSSAKATTGFKIGSVDGTINEDDHTIAVTLPYGTDVSSLTPTITVSDKATVSPADGAAQNFTSPVVYTVKAENESTQTYTVTVTIAADTRSTAKAITKFKIGSVDGTINEADHTIAVTLPYGTDVKSLTPTITASDKASVSPLSGVVQDFTSPVVYTVKAENESTQIYTVTVTVAPDTRSTAKAITGFKIGSVDGTINETDHSIGVTLPYGTNVTSLTPTITVSDKATVSPLSGAAQDFTNSVVYTVTAENEITQPYTITVTIAKNTAKAITGFSIGGNAGAIDETNHNIAVTVPFGTDVSSMTPSITVSDKATVSPAGGIVQNFSNPVTYTVTAEDGTEQPYTVTVTVAKNTAKAITGFSIGGNAGAIDETNHKIAVTLPYGTDVKSLTPTITASDKATVSPASGVAQDFTNSVVYTVTAEDGTTQPYTVTVTVAKNTAKAITGFSIGGNAGTIDETNHKIAVILPYGTDVKSLTPTITASDKATVSPANGTAQDFTNPVVYTVKAENESTQTYTVTVTIAPDTRSTAKAITGFKIGSADGIINENNHTIAVTLPYGTDVKSLTPTITVSNKANVSPFSGAVQDFTKPVAYTVKAENESTQTYTVTVTVSAAPNNGNSSGGNNSNSSNNSSSGSSSGSGSNANSSSASKQSNITVTIDKNITTASQTITASNRSNGVAAASVTGAQISEMIAMAEKKATDGNAQTAVTIQVEAGNGAVGMSVTIPKEAEASLTGRVSAMTVSSSVATVTLDRTALAEISKQTSGDIRITATTVDTFTLSEETKNAIGIRPVYDLKISSGDTTVSDFGGGIATVSVPYTPTSGEDVNAIVVYYVDALGKLMLVPNCVYDAKTGKVTFSTTHFSTYAVGYNKVSLSDVSDSAWYKDYVAYLAARSIVAGNNGLFSPDKSTTRAEFVTILARMSGDNLSGYTTSSFADVATDSWYRAAVQWAYKAGITSGYDGKFSPNTSITREQMAAMLYHYAEYKGTVSKNKSMSVREFSDDSSISSWAQAPIQWAMNNRIISGNSDGSFAPQSSATRAQAAKMLAVLLQ